MIVQVDIVIRVKQTELISMFVLQMCVSCVDLKKVKFSPEQYHHPAPIWSRLEDCPLIDEQSSPP